MAVKYRIESSDRLGVKWKVDFSDATFTGDVTSLKAGANPIVFDFDNSSDDVFDPVRPTSAEIQIMAETNFVLQSLYSDVLKITVNIYADDVLYFSGWVEPQNYSEAYEPVPYVVTVTIIDGLSDLKNIEYKNGDVYYSGRRFDSQIVLDCLGKIGFTEFKEYCNIYEDSMLATANDSPFDQIMTDPYIYRDISCWEVLIDLLGKYNAFIRQYDGVFCIVRPKELTGASVAGRYFTAYNTKTSVTMTPTQHIKRIGQSSYRVQVPGGQLMIQRPVKKVRILHDVGDRESWIENYNFTDVSGSGFNYNFDYWTEVGSAPIATVSYVLPAEREGLLLDYSSAPGSNYVYQSFGEYAKATTVDEFVLSFDWLFYNITAAEVANVELRIMIKADAGPYYLVESNDAECTWTGTASKIIVKANAVLGSTGWTSWSRKFTGLPADGSYTISIYPLYNSQLGVFGAINNIKLYTSSIAKTMIPVKTKRREKIFFLRIGPKYETQRATAWKESFDLVEVLEQEYTSQNVNNGTYVTRNVLSGDLDVDIENVPQQFAGALVLNTGTAQVKVDKIVLTGSSGSAYISCGGTGNIAEYDTDLTTTANNFVTDHAADYLPIVVTASGGEITFTGDAAGEDFTTAIYTQTGDLSGTLSEGTAFTYVLAPSDLWSTGTGRSGAENTKLLQVIADEITAMYVRSKQLIQMPIVETNKALQINTLGAFHDSVNTYNSATRVFSMNRGRFNVRARKWEIDLFEIGTGAIVSGTTSTTGDSTDVTADSTIITVDTI